MIVGGMRTDGKAWMGGLWSLKESGYDRRTRVEEDMSRGDEEEGRQEGVVGRSREGDEGKRRGETGSEQYERRGEDRRGEEEKIIGG